MNRVGWALTSIAMGLVLLIAAVGLFSVLNRGRDAALVDALNTARNQHDPTFDADFATLFPGNWGRVAVICRGATRSEVVDAIGFQWEGAAKVDSEEFLSSIVFIDGTTAESLISTGPDSGWLYVPCPIDVDGSPDDESEPHVVAVPRRQASVRFTYEQHEDAHYWFVDAAEFRRLATLGE